MLKFGTFLLTGHRGDRALVEIHILDIQDGDGPYFFNTLLACIDVNFERLSWLAVGQLLIAR